MATISGKGSAGAPKRAITSKRPTKFRVVATENQELRDIQRNVQDAVEGLDNNIILKNKLLEEIDIVGGGTVTIKHGLGQRPRGWTIVDRNGDARVWRIDWSDTTIVLSASADVTVSIMVY